MTFHDGISFLMNLGIILSVCASAAWILAVAGLVAESVFGWR